jgi:hypothetical protein
VIQMLRTMGGAPLTQWEGFGASKDLAPPAANPVPFHLPASSSDTNL